MTTMQTLPSSGVRSWYAINRKADKPREVEVMIYDEIGLWGITAKQFVSDLQKIEAETIHLRLNTYGGEVVDATAIYNALREHPARIITHIDGAAISAGSFIAMAGDEIRMADNAYMMIHNAWGGAMGDADDLKGYADVLEKMNENIAKMYQRKAGGSLKHWRDLMDVETWFTAEEARDEGLVDVVFEASPTEKIPAAAAGGRFKAYNMANIPEPIKRAWGQQANPPVASATFTISGNTQPITITTPVLMTGPHTIHQVTSPAADSPQREPAPAPAQPQEASAMAETNPQAAPAQTPAAATGQIPQGNTPNPAPATPVASVQPDLPQNATPLGYVNHGKKLGIEDGKKIAHDRLVAITAACPGKPQMAIDAFLAGHTPDAVALAFNAAVAADAVRQAEIDKLRADNQRLEALMATGGNTGVVLEMIGESQLEAQWSGGEPQSIADPKAYAEQEWDFKPSVRKGFSSKESYVAWRKRDLAGTVRMQVVSSGSNLRE